MPATPEEEWTYWDTKATELRRTQLATIQTSATKWTALMTALLGVFGTVAFAGGLTTVDKLDGPWDLIARSLTTVAAVVAVVAIVYLSLAAGGLTVSSAPGLTAAAVRDRNTTQVEGALSNLSRGRWLAIGAAALVLVGSTIVLWKSEASPPTKPSVFVAVVEGKAICGPITKTNDELQIGGVSLKKVSDLLPVTACP